MKTSRSGESAFYKVEVEDETECHRAISILEQADRDAMEHELLRFVGIHSVNPEIDNGPGETEPAIELESEFMRLGSDPLRQEVAGEGRNETFGRLEGAPGVACCIVRGSSRHGRAFRQSTTDARLADGRV